MFKKDDIIVCVNTTGKNILKLNKKYKVNQAFDNIVIIGRRMFTIEKFKLLSEIRIEKIDKIKKCLKKVT